MPLPRKPSGEATSERRAMVMRLKAMGQDNSQISRTLEVNRKTVQNDLKRIREAARLSAERADVFAEVGAAASELKVIAEEALKCYDQATDLAVKNKCLLTAISAIVKRIELMMETGIIPKAPLEMNLSVEELRRMPTEELIRRRDEMVRKLAEEVNNGQAGGDKPTPPPAGGNGESRTSA